MRADRDRCPRCGRDLADEADSDLVGLCWANAEAVARTKGRDPRFKLQCDAPRLSRQLELEQLLERVRETAERAAEDAYALPSDAEAAADLYAALDELVAMIDAALPRA